MSAPASPPQCDFCSSPEVRWVYPAADFVIPTDGPLPDWGSEGGWAACQPCYAAIESGDPERLVRRCAKRLCKMHPELSLKVTIAALRDGQKRFWEHRHGDAQPFAAAPEPIDIAAALRRATGGR